MAINLVNQPNKMYKQNIKGRNYPETHDSWTWHSKIE
jgi:hypothetical protein